MPKFQIQQIKTDLLNSYFKSLAIVNEHTYIEVFPKKLTCRVTNQNYTFVKVSSLKFSDAVSGNIDQFDHIVIPTLTMTNLVKAVSFFRHEDVLNLAFDCYEGDFEGEACFIAQSIIMSSPQLKLKFETNDIGGVGKYFDDEKLAVFTKIEDAVCSFIIKSKHRKQVNQIASLYYTGQKDQTLKIEINDSKVILGADKTEEITKTEDDYELLIGSAKFKTEPKDILCHTSFNTFKMLDDDDYQCHVIPFNGGYNLVSKSISSNSITITTLD